MSSKEGVFQLLEEAELDWLEGEELELDEYGACNCNDELEGA